MQVMDATITSYSTSACAQGMYYREISFLFICFEHPHLKLLRHVAPLALLTIHVFFFKACYDFIAPCACTRGKVIGSVVVVVVVDTKSFDLEIWATERVINTINLSISARNWPWYA